jgi:hypothetical protein
MEKENGYEEGCKRGARYEKGPMSSRAFLFLAGIWDMHVSRKIILIAT